jgi:hypothetical protein
MLIRISGRAAVTRDDGRPLSAADLQELDGATSDDTCVNYLHDKALAELGLTGGAVKLVRDPGRAEFGVVTEYGSPTKLRPTVLKQLAAATAGQWSDGIGGSCFDELADRLGVTIDLSPPDQSAHPRAEQIDDGKKVPRASKSKTALAKAAGAGDLETVRKLLDAGADPNVPHQGYSPLLHALGGGHADIALVLIDRGADIHAKDPAGSDALLCTAMCHQLSDEGAARVARVLLERGVGVHRRERNPKFGGSYTPLFMAENRKKAELAKVLREFGAVE